MKILLTILLTLLAALVIGAGVIHGGGLTNFAGDEPHAELINEVIEFARERFIAARSADLEVPDLNDPSMLADGAAHYVPMCSGCHLGPGAPDTEIRRGLYPQPPKLAQPAGHAGGHDHSDMQKSAKRQFWIVKHGIKMTGMPAWGATHDDQAIWGLIAFLQKLPEMSPEEYAALSEGAGERGHGGGQPPASSGGRSHFNTASGTGARRGGHMDPPGAKPQPEAKDDPHTDEHQH